MVWAVAAIVLIGLGWGGFLCWTLELLDEVDRL